jgi:hypothetical protein
VYFRYVQSEPARLTCDVSHEAGGASGQLGRCHVSSGQARIGARLGSAANPESMDAFSALFAAYPRNVFDECGASNYGTFPSRIPAAALVGLPCLESRSAEAAIWSQIPGIVKLLRLPSTNGRSSVMTV